jgi:PST family polysaccharide transporter
LIATVNGYRDFKTLAKLKVTNSLVALVMSGSLAWFFLLKGALIAQAVNTSIVFLISFALIFRNRNSYFSFNYLFFDKIILKKLLAFTLMALTSAQLKPFVQLFLRDYIITHGNEFDAGIWEATKRLSQYYILVLTTALGAYYLPKLSSLTTNLALRKEIISGIKIIMPLFILIALLIYILKGWIIQLLFSVEFLPMKELIFPQLIGDFFMIFSFMIAYLMLAKAMVKVFMISQIIFAGVRILLSITFFNIGGIEGVVWANAANYFLYTCFVLITFKKVLFAKEY